MADDMHKRLASARKSAGYDRPTEAARALEMAEPTYLAHENGSRGFKKETAKRYARQFGVSYEWLYLNEGTRERRKAAPGEIRTVPLVGYVAAGEAHYFNDSGKLDDVVAPLDASEDTVAVEIRGESLGQQFNNWLAFYDNVQRPVTNDIINQLCVVGLMDGRIMVKLVKRSLGKAGLFHLISNDPPILDVEIEWAAKVIHMRPR